MNDADRAVRAKAAELGFDAFGVARADIPLESDHAQYAAFLRAGYHGTMAYLARNRSVRRSLSDPGILPGARSVICVAVRYAVRAAGPQPGIVDGVAKYARGRDYHNHVRNRLRKLARFVRSLEPGAAARPLIDTAPVLERAWAARSGIGFIGKNGMLICPGLGSFTVLGEVVTTVRLTPGQPMPSRCGRCVACLKACPTEAFVRPFVLDARRCISYLTIEHRGAWPGSEVQAIAPRIFGCDTCQDVCPYNRAQGAWLAAGGPFDVLERWCSTTRTMLLTASPDDLTKLLEGSALRRVSTQDWRRNAIASLQGQIPTNVVGALREIMDDRDAPLWLVQMARQVVAFAQTPGHGDTP